MSLLKRFSIPSLVAANGLALGVLLGVEDTAAFGGDYCPSSAIGCHCWDGGGISPPGCYEQYAPEFQCHGGDWCGED